MCSISLALIYVVLPQTFQFLVDLEFKHLLTEFAPKKAGKI